MNTFAQAVEAYAKHDTEFVTPIRQALINGDALEAIRRIAGIYRVARNFPRRFDEGLGIARYEPVVRALKTYSPSGGIGPIDAVLRLTGELQQIYHREVLSAASKFLWFAWGREIIIYDSQALATLQMHSLNLRSKDYPAYCASWKSLFSEYSREIADECTKQRASNEDWFHERVFD